MRSRPRNTSIARLGDLTEASRFPSGANHDSPYWLGSMDGKTLFAGFMGTHGTGCSCRTVSARTRMFDVSASCMLKLMQRVDATSNCRPRKFGGHKPYALAELEDKVRALVAETPDLTITELWQKITALRIRVGRSAVARFLLHLQLTFKKNPACRRAGTPGRQGGPAAWREMQKSLDPQRRVFIDESVLQRHGRSSV